MRERHANILAALRERYVSASISQRERAHRCLSAIAEIQSTAEYKYSSILPF